MISETIRIVRYSPVIAGIWDDPADNEANIRWVRDYYDAIHPHSGSDGGYVNFMSDDDGGRMVTLTPQQIADHIALITGGCAIHIWVGSVCGVPNHQRIIDGGIGRGSTHGDKYPTAIQ